MAHAIWKGQVSFGLLNVPVTLYSGEVRNDIKLRMLDSRNDARVRYERVNEETGDEVPWNDIVKAYEYEKGNYVKIDQEELKEFLTEANNNVELEAFIDAGDLDPRFYEKPYYLVPQKKFEKGYVLLREALRQSGMIGIARVVIRTRNHLAALMPYDNALILNILRFCEEVRAMDNYSFPSADPADYRISDKELKMSVDLINSMKTAWDPDDYHDEYRKRLLEFVEQKVKEDQGIKEKASRKEEPAEPSSNVVDLQDLLRKSLEKKSSDKPRKAARSGDDEEAGASRKGSKSRTGKAAASTKKPASSKKSGSSGSSGRKRKSS
jgi:DNA end-binding protein Ku